MGPETAGHECAAVSTGPNVAGHGWRASATAKAATCGPVARTSTPKIDSPATTGIPQARSSAYLGAIDSICSITSLIASGCLSGG